MTKRDYKDWGKDKLVLRIEELEASFLELQIDYRICFRNRAEAEDVKAQQAAQDALWAERPMRHSFTLAADSCPSPAMATWLRKVAKLGGAEVKADHAAQDALWAERPSMGALHELSRLVQAEVKSLKTHVRSLRHKGASESDSWGVIIADLEASSAWLRKVAGNGGGS